MKYLSLFLIIFITFGCSSFSNKVVSYFEKENSEYLTKIIEKVEEDSVQTQKDTLQTILEKFQKKEFEYQLQIDSLYDEIGTLQDSIDFLNSTIRIKNHSEFPDSLFFCGQKFDFTNERLKQKFVKCYNSVLKSAYRYIPRSGKYFPVIEEIIAKYNLPEDMKYLAVAESHLTPFAESSAGAVGIWQFIKSTAKYFDLEINQFVDMRQDIFASTHAACQYIQQHHKTLQNMGVDDVLLAMCSFNSGFGNIKRAIREQGGNDFFSLIQRMSETDDYIWRIIAIKYIFENEAKIFTKKFKKEPNLFSTCKVVTLTMNGHYKLDDWAQAQGTVIKKVWELNPWIKIYRRKRYRYSAINNVILSPGTYAVLLPKNAIPNKEKLSDIEKKFLNKNQGYFAAEHIVRSGENLSIIAKQYNTTVAQLMGINGLTSTLIYPGQKLKLISANKNGKYYVVKKGDSLFLISRNLGVSQKYLIQNNNLRVKNNNGKKIVYIYPNQKLFY